MLKLRLKRRLARARSAEEARRLLTTPPFRIPAGVSITEDTIGGVPGEWVEATAHNGPVLLYLHGGGYFACSAKTHRPITVYYAQNGFRVFAPDYRLAPEYPFPAALEDAVSVYNKLLADDGPIVVSGESAGGGLALALMLSARDSGASLPAAAALFSPWTDLAATGRSIVTNDRRCAMFNGSIVASCAAHYVGSADRRNPLISPLYGDLRGLPPLLIHVGSNEVLRDDSTRLAEYARAAGVPVSLRIFPVVPHGWQLQSAHMPEARESLGLSAGFLRQALESAHRGSAA
jgi:acetyl esterase/lipase